MRKVLFLMFLLLLMGLGAASVKAQVRIGGNGAPNGAAVLDLNTTDATNNGTKGLALPRVSLSSNTAQITSGVANLIGMLVYNASGSLSTGVYYWSGTNWNRVDGATLGGDTIVGNEVTNATAAGGLVRNGAGTTASPYTLSIAAGGVTPTMLAAPTANVLTSLLHSGGKWLYATYSITTAAVNAPADGSTYAYTADISTCLSNVNYEFYGGNSAFNFSWWLSGGSVYVHNNGSIPLNLTLYAACWRAE